jgi:hypothetical protein
MTNHRWLVYIVANTVDPYAYELPAILGYPSGLIYRARFKLEWVDRELWERSDILLDQPCIVVYRDFDAAILYPIRYGTIRRARLYGDVLHIEYELGQIIPYHRTLEQRRNQVSVFNDAWRREHPDAAATNVAQGDMRPLVLRSKLWPEIQNPYLSGMDEASQEFESWSNVGGLVADIPLYGALEFLKVIGLGSGSDTRRETPRRGVYRLLPNRTYELRIAQRIFRASDIVKPHKTSFTCDGHGLRTITEARRAVGKYDIFTFRFQTEQPGVRTSTGVLSVTGEMADARPLELELLAHVSPQWRLRGAALAVIGAIALLWPELLLHLGADHRMTDLAQRVGTLLFVFGVFDSRSVLEYLR